MDKNKTITAPILFTASRLESIANRFVFQPMGTSFSSMKILRLLELKGPQTPKRILELAGGTKSNLSQRLNYLEKNRFIVRDYAVVPGDKRQVVVKLTALGRKRLNLINLRIKKAQLTLAECFSQKEIEGHRKFFEKMNRILDREEKNLSKIFS